MLQCAPGWHSRRGDRAAVPSSAPRASFAAGRAPERVLPSVYLRVLDAIHGYNRPDCTTRLRNCCVRSSCGFSKMS
jgi:hypothetical protein